MSPRPRTPAFWTAGGPLATLLAPVSWIWGAVAAARMRRDLRFVASVPVIVVGNLTAGGAGKTPTVRVFAGLLAAMERRPFVVSRGYGGRLSGPVRVDPRLHTAADVGDEPLLLAHDFDVVVARDRAAGTRFAIEAGAGVVLLDDGFQSAQVAVDLATVVIDRGFGIGNGRVIPAGPLRAPLAVQLDSAHLIVDLDGGDGDRSASAAVLEAARRRGLPVLSARLEPRDPGRFAGRRVLAFAGIGRPEKFAATLRRAGVEVVRFHALGDHAPLGEADAAAMLAEAERDGLDIITTEKDAARLAGTAQGACRAIADRASVFAVDLVFDDPVEVAARLDALFGHKA